MNKSVPSSICGIIDSTVAESDDLSDAGATAQTATVATMDAVLTMELQRGVCGDLASLAALRDEVTVRSVVENTRRLCVAARSTARPVVHCTFSIRADRAGTDFTIPLMGAARKDPDYLLQHTAACELLEGLGQAGDHLSDRHHGVSPFGGTGLNQRLHALGVTNLVVAGVSLNVGIIGAAIEAVNLGYHVTVAADAVAALPGRYGEEVLRNSISAIARVRTVDDIIAAWI